MSCRLRMPASVIDIIQVETGAKFVVELLWKRKSIMAVASIDPGGVGRKLSGFEYDIPNTRPIAKYNEV